MYLIISSRERKIIFLSMLINTLLFTAVGLVLFILNGSFSTIIKFAAFIFIIQFSILATPSYLQLFFFNSQSPSEKTKVLESKIATLQEEIKRVNGEDYDENHNF